MPTPAIPYIIYLLPSSAPGPFNLKVAVTLPQTVANHAFSSFSIHVPSKADTLPRKATHVTPLARIVPQRPRPELLYPYSGASSPFPAHVVHQAPSPCWANSSCSFTTIVALHTKAAKRDWNVNITSDL